MKYRRNPQTFIRSVNNESMLWNRRTSACAILQDAETFLLPLEADWKSADSILEEIAGRYALPPSEIASDVKEFYSMLVHETFVDADGEIVQPEAVEVGDASGNPSNREQHDDSWTPLGSFFERHGSPCEFHIDLTSACTERCVHCYIPEYAHRFLDFKLVCKALDEYVALGGLTVHLSGGECMMHPQFEEILRACKERNINMIILSNMTLCDDRKLALLKEMDPQFINVSLYSMRPEQHDAITRLPGSWHRTMDAILRCEHAGVHIRLAAPVLKENREHYGELKEFADEHHMHLIPDCDIFPQCDHDDSNMDHALSAGQLRDFLQENRCLFADGYSQCRMPGAEEKVCDIGEARICLDSQGHYYPCDGTHGLILGDVRKDTLEEVWHGEAFNRLRALKNRDFPTCVACENRPYCKVCPAHNFNATGDVMRHSTQKCAFATVKREVFGR